jgi:large subunit ribosomal protein L5
MSRLRKKYREEIREALHKRFSYGNCMLIPRLEKVVISMGVAEATKDRNVIQDCVRELSMISGQKPQVTKASKSIANFKLREGQAIGLKVTLRGERMWHFIDRFINIVSPRIRDFRGFKARGDGRGNYSVGLSSQDVFPEVDLDQIKRTQGMNVTVVTTARSDDECNELLKGLGMPFVK